MQYNMQNSMQKNTVLLKVHLLTTIQKTLSKSPKYNSLLKFSGVRYLPFPVCIAIMLPTVSAIA